MLKNYLKIAFKVLLRRKFFTFISLFAISFTLMVLMVATALLDHFFAPLPPENQADRTLNISYVCERGPNIESNGMAGYGLLDTYCRNLPGVEKMAVFEGQTPITSYLGEQKVTTYLKHTDSVFWEVLDFQFVEGGPYTAEQEKNADFVAVINQATQQKFFGSGQSVGKTIELDGQRFRVIGVVKNIPDYRVMPFADVWVPVTTLKSDTYRKSLRGNFIGMLVAHSPADFPAIKTELAARMKRVQLNDPQITEITTMAETKLEALARLFTPRQEEGSPVAVIAGFVVLALLFMLLPTINLININVSRIMERSSEIGVRRAFGASSRTLIGQFIVENLILTFIGGFVALIGSVVILRMLSQSQLFLYGDLHLNPRVFAYGFVMAVVFGLLSGVFPAWKMSRLHPVQALKGGVR